MKNNHWQEKLKLMNRVKKEFQNHLGNYGWKMSINLEVVDNFWFPETYIDVTVWWEDYFDIDDSCDDPEMIKTFRITNTNFESVAKEIQKYMEDNFLT